MIAKSQTIRVPITSADTCGAKSTETGRPCRRATGHGGRHAFFWTHVIPGLVREVWAHCQECGAYTTDGAVCGFCGGE